MSFASYADVEAALKAESDNWSATEGHKDAAIRQRALEARDWWAKYNSSASTTAAASTPAPPPAPQLPNFKPMTANNKNFKVAPSDIIQFDDESIEIALISDLLFEDIGATELSNISRYDLIDGQSVIYEPIKNLSTIRQEFNPNNIVSTSLAMDYFSRFAIDLSFRGISEPYFDESGGLVISIDLVEDSEEVQVQILTNGTIDLVEDV